MTNIHTLTWIGIVLLGLGTLFTIWGQQKINDKYSKELVSKTERVEKLSEENIKLSKENTKLAIL